MYEKIISKCEVGKLLLELGDVQFQKLSELKNNLSNVPEEKGIYMIFKSPDYQNHFLEEHPACKCSPRNPNIDTEKLKECWQDDAHILYIERAGGLNFGTSLSTKLEQLVKFGQGIDGSHWGGRAIWQLADLDNLIVCYVPLPGKNPVDVLKKALAKYKEEYGQLPFANAL